MLAIPYRRRLIARAARPARGGRRFCSAIVWSAPALLRRCCARGPDRRPVDERALRRLRLHPQILHSHPLFGLGLNNFSVYYEFVTGKTNWGPHSFYVALVVETGLVGTLAVRLFLRYLFVRLRAARALGRALARRATVAAACARSRGG